MVGVCVCVSVSVCMKDIGIVSGFNLQRRIIRDQFKIAREGSQGIVMGNTDMIQGREHQAVFISTVVLASVIYGNRFVAIIIACLYTRVFCP